MNRMPPKVPRPTPAPRVDSLLLKNLLQLVESGDITRAEVENRLAEMMLQGLPLIEFGDGSEHSIVTFFYEDQKAQQVLIFVNRLTDEKNLADSLMEEILDTGIFTISFAVEQDWRASYCFIPAYPGEQPIWLSEDNQVRLRYALDRGEKDIRNPLACLNRAGRHMSVAELPEAPPQPYVLSPEELQTLTEITWETTKDGRPIALIPIGEVSPTSPVFFILDGEVWASMGIHASAALAYEKGVLPACYLVLVDSGGREVRWAELDGSAPYAHYLEQALIPWLTEHGVKVAAERTFIAGQSLGGLTSLLTVLERPDLCTGAIAQSSSLWQTVVFDSLNQRLATGTCEELAHLKLHIEVGKQEWALVPPHRQLLELLDQAKVDYSYTEYNGGHDYACWRGSLIDHLIAMLQETKRQEN